MDRHMCHTGFSGRRIGWPVACPLKGATMAGAIGRSLPIGGET
jgi:hypothetical protein